jgi:hypothetical protein
LVLTALSHVVLTLMPDENSGAATSGHEAVKTRAIAPAWLERFLATTAVLGSAGAAPSVMKSPNY